MTTDAVNDPVNHPAHYTSHPSGIEAIDVAEAFNFNLGNAIKYIWRAGLKSDDPAQDLEKAAWYLQREVARLKKLTKKQATEKWVADLAESMQKLVARNLMGGEQASPSPGTADVTWRIPTDDGWTVDIEVELEAEKLVHDAAAAKREEEA